MFALGLQPTGSKDPFALRRQGNGIIKTIAEHKFVIDLGQLFKDAREAYRTSPVEKRFSSSLDFNGNVKHFLRERLEFYLREVHGFKYDVVNAVLAAGVDDVVDAVARAQAVTQVRPSPDFESISVAFKRMKNILRQAAESGTRIADSLDGNVLQEPAEKILATQVPDTARVVAQLSGERNYQQALVAVSRLRPAIDSFFDKVMVMVDDDRIRSNRLSLLQTLLKEFSTIADFSEIVTEGKESKESSKQ
jgi:glycyl-tRNA synthetase beta chain